MSDFASIVTHTLLKALRDAGYVIVPIEPTAAMLEGSVEPDVTRFVWRKMVKAALSDDR